jgi:hypothetical protein
MLPIGTMTVLGSPTDLHHLGLVWKRSKSNHVVQAMLVIAAVTRHCR